MTDRSNRFDLLPAAAFELLEEVMNGEPAGYQPEDETPESLRRADAYELCWGWDPPLMHPGNERDVTMHGLAALAWRRQQSGRASDELTLDERATAIYTASAKQGVLLTKKQIAERLGKRTQSLAPGRGL